MDQDDRRPITDIEIRDPLIVDENGFDRDAFYRGTFQRFKIGRDLCRRSTGGHEIGYEAQCERYKPPRSIEEGDWAGDGAIPVE